MQQVTTIPLGAAECALPYGLNRLAGLINRIDYRRTVLSVLAAIQVTAPVANAVLYSPDTKVPRTAEVALRKAIPVVNPSMKNIQEPLENIFYLLRIPQRKPYSSMETDVKKALKLAVDNKSSIISSIPEDQKEKGLQLYNDLVDEKTGLGALIASIAIKDADLISVRLASTLDTIAQIELLQAPGLPYLLPSQYQEYPRLVGRASVELTVEKENGSGFIVKAGKGLQQYGTIEIVLDGYSAPITAGNFTENVLKGLYNGVKLKTTEQAVISDNQETSGKFIPMEILPAGEFQPLYRTSLNVQDGELPVLPLSVYGAVAMSHASNAEDCSSPTQFFFYLYDKRSAGLGGLSFEEGQFSVFGYATKGKELLSQLRSGDIIKSVKLVTGADRLIDSSKILL